MYGTVRIRLFEMLTIIGGAWRSPYIADVQQGLNLRNRKSCEEIADALLGSPHLIELKVWDNEVLRSVKTRDDLLNFQLHIIPRFDVAR